MELIKKQLHYNREGKRMFDQFVLDEDYNVPDAKPDIGRIIQSKGNVSMDEVRLSDGKAFIRGNLIANVLYVGDEDKNVYSLEAKLPFDEILNLEGVENGDKITAECKHKLKCRQGPRTRPR